MQEEDIESIKKDMYNNEFKINHLIMNYTYLANKILRIEQTIETLTERQDDIRRDIQAIYAEIDAFGQLGYIKD